MKYLILLAVMISQGLGAVTLGEERSLYSHLLSSELKGWAGPGTASSVKLEYGCGVMAELHLIGNHRRNSLLLGITNSSQEAVVIKNSEIKFQYDGVKERYPGFTHHASDNRILVGWWSINQIPFPKKEDFREIKEITVVIPVINEVSRETCYLTTKFHKNKQIASEAVTYSALEFALDVGNALGQAGNIQRLGDPGGMVAFEFNYFPAPEWGFGIVFSNETNFKNSPKSSIYKRFYEGPDYEASISYFGFQYLRRFFLGKDLTLQYALGPGYQTVEDRNHRYVVSTEGEGLAFSQKLMLNWRYHQWFLPTAETMDFILGGGLVHFYTPGMKIGGEHLDGHRTGWLLRLGFHF